jgi:hypothetical protein
MSQALARMSSKLDSASVTVGDSPAELSLDFKSIESSGRDTAATGRPRLPRLRRPAAAPQSGVLVVRLAFKLLGPESESESRVPIIMITVSYLGPKLRVPAGVT